MAESIKVIIPHKLTQAEAVQRIDAAVNRVRQSFGDKIAEIDLRWDGPKLDAQIRAMGQTVTANADVRPTEVELDVYLPVMLMMLKSKIEGYLRDKGQKALT